MKTKKLVKGILCLKLVFWTGVFALNKFIFHQGEKLSKELEKDSFYTSKYGKLHYTVTGRGKPILLIHGIGAGCSHLEWKKNIVNLSKSYQVYALDLLGFGFSDKPKITYTSYLFICLILDFIKNVIKTPAYVIASNLSADFVIKAYELEPNWFRKLILIEPNGMHQTLPENQDKYFRKILECPILGTSIYLYLTSKSNCKAFLSKYIFFSKEYLEKDDYWMNSYAMAHTGSSNSKYAMASFLTHFMNVDISQSITHLNVPVLFVWGENSILTPLTDMEEIQTKKPRSQYVLFEQTRQLPHYENHEEFNKIVKEFIR